MILELVLITVFVLWILLWYFICRCCCPRGPCCRGILIIRWIYGKIKRGVLFVYYKQREWIGKKFVDKMDNKER